MFVGGTALARGDAGTGHRHLTLFSDTSLCRDILEAVLPVAMQDQAYELTNSLNGSMPPFLEMKQRLMRQGRSVIPRDRGIWRQNASNPPLLATLATSYAFVGSAPCAVSFVFVFLFVSGHGSIMVAN
jgi:hypothetical protein